MKKKILIGLLLLVVLLVAGVAALVARLDVLVKQGVETLGPKVTQSDVKLEGVKLSLLGGSGALRGLHIGNPPGYKSDAAMKLGELRLSLVPGSLLSDKVHVKSIALLAPEITIEGGLKENNLTKLLANAQAYSGPTDTNQADTATAQTKLQVDSLVVRGAKVTARLDLLGGQPLSYTIPDFEITNLGQGPDGITGSELGARVLDLVIGKAMTGLAGQATQVGTQALDAAARSAQDSLKDSLKDPSKALQGISDLMKKKQP